MSIDLGLQRISRLLARTPLKWRAIHVAGTNGKGSVTAYASTMLDVYNRSTYRQKHGQPSLKHARFNSPHLIDPWDCISINNRVISQNLYDHFGNIIRKRNDAEGIQATNFEILTATAFEIFTHEEVDIGIVEVGMGGRLDATNVIGQVTHSPQPGEEVAERLPPLVTAVTRIGRDHQAFLGNSLEQIATEKAGIFKPGVPVVYDTDNPSTVREVLKKQALDLQCEVLSPQNFSAGQRRVIRRSAKLEVRIPAHQLSNLNVAYRAVWQALTELGKVEKREHPSLEESKLGLEMLSGAINDTVYPGRLQHLDIGPLVCKDGFEALLDGAHNAQSAAALSKYVYTTHKIEPGRRAPVSWVLAFSDTKDVSEMLTELLRPGDNVSAVEFGPVADMPWVKAMDSEIIAEAAEKMMTADGVHAQSFGDDVVSAVKATAEEGSPVVIAGSLYLVGDVLRRLRELEKP